MWLIILLLAAFSFQPAMEQDQDEWKTRKISVEDVKAFTALHQLLPEKIRDVPVNAFQMTIKHSTQLTIVNNEGSTFSDETIAALQKVKPKDVIYFDNITQLMEDGTIRIFNMKVMVTP